VIRCQCEGLELETTKWALQDLALFRQGKPAKTTLMLISTLLDLGVSGFTLLDIGGGIGTIQLELLRAGATEATSIEASAAYLQIARRLAAEASLDERIAYIHGDFVTLADRIPEADVVALDRVVCCYDDVEPLVSLSASKTRRLYALVYPRSEWWVRWALFFENLGYRLRGSPFRAFVHPTQLIDRLVRTAGLQLVHHDTTFAWQVVVYRRLFA
jgi:SAM-dependent methyltransferase